MRKHLRAVLLGQCQALGPISVAGIHVQPWRILRSHHSRVFRIFQVTSPSNRRTVHVSGATDELITISSRLGVEKCRQVRVTDLARTETLRPPPLPTKSVLYLPFATIFPSTLHSPANGISAPIFHHADHVRAVLLRELPRFVPHLAHDGMHRRRAGLRGFQGMPGNLAGDVAIDRFTESVDAFVQLRGRLFRAAHSSSAPSIKRTLCLKPLDELQPLGDDRHDIGVALLSHALNPKSQTGDPSRAAFLGVLHGQAHRVLPDLTREKLQG